MRVTAKKKQQTRQRIIESARHLFSGKGYDQTTTRNIAEAAGIAVGTMFNYFPTKEALAMTIVESALEQAAQEFESKRRDDQSLEEVLFAQVAMELRHLAPHRAYIGEVLETALSPFARDNSCEQAQTLRINHLESVGAIIAAGEESPPQAPGAIALHLYWTLYLGVLSFWSQDNSYNQEDTLAVLDQSMRLFAGSLATGS